MHDGNIRYMGLGVLLYIMAPAFVLYGAFNLVSHSGDQIIDWAMTSTTSITAAYAAPVSTPVLGDTTPLLAAPAPSPGEKSMNSMTQDWRRREEWPEDAYTEELERTVPMDSDGHLSINNVSGNITITSWTRSEARIYAKKVARAYDEEEAQEAFEEVRIEIDEHRGDVEIQTRYPDRRYSWGPRRPSVSVYYEITIPEKASARAHSVSGSVEVSELLGEVAAKSVSGHVRVSDIGNRVRAESVSGNVDVQNLNGDTDLKSVSGSIEARTITGDIEAHTTSGRIDLNGITSRRLSAESTSGTVRFEGSINQEGRYTFGTMSGDVRVTVPSDAAFDLRAQTFSGYINTDFPITLRGTISSRHGRKRNLSGTVNGGGADVEISAFSGSVEIRSR